MIEEQRRRAFLGAMQITSWLPRQPLPFAAPSRPELLETPPREEPAVPVRARGSCTLLVELPTGEPFASRDPGYLLLRDLLRAAGLPDSPRLIGEPVRWPLLARGNLDQGPQAALEFVQSFVAARMEESERSRCLWLVGLPAIRFAGEGDEGSLFRELQVDGLGATWAVPGLEALMEEPALKGELWRAMRRVRQRWSSEIQ
ncbi:protein TonB [Pseudomonas aeruginosa VRFPA09]|nr:protein TonB [Pseudomonas aeruginosa VRFPA09]